MWRVEGLSPSVGRKAGQEGFLNALTYVLGDCAMTAEAQRTWPKLYRVIEQDQRRASALIQALREPPGDMGLQPLRHRHDQRSALAFLEQASLAHRAPGRQAAGEVDPAKEPVIIDVARQAAAGSLRCRHGVAQGRHHRVARGRRAAQRHPAERGRGCQE